MELKIILLICALLVNLLFSFFLFFSRKTDIRQGYYSYVCLTTAHWVLSALYFYTLVTPEYINIALKSMYASGIYMGISFCHFSFVYTKREIFWSKLKYIYYTVCGIYCIFIYTSNYIVGQIQETRDVFAIGDYYITYPVVVSILFFTSYYNYIKFTKYSTISKKRFSLMFIFMSGTFTSIFSGFLFNIILPYYNIFKYFWVGPLLTVIFILFTIYATLRYKMFGARSVITEIVTGSIWILMFIQILTDLGNKDTLNYLNYLIFLLAILGGVFLVKNIRKEILQKNDLERLSKTLIKLNLNTKKISDRKTEFLSIAAHQFRSPLTSILGFTSLLQDNTLGEISPMHRSAANKIMVSSRDLTGIVEDFLNISRIEKGTLEYHKQSVDMKQLLAIVYEEQKIVAEQKGIIFELEYNDDDQFIAYTDEGKIKQIATNIVDNAIKYTPKGNVTIFLKKDSKRIFFGTIDTGIGMSPETINVLFQQFTRGKDSYRTNISGSGLGLYIAKKMIKGLGGKIKAQSKGLGKGSVFTVEIEEKREGIKTPAPKSVFMLGA